MEGLTVKAWRWSDASPRSPGPQHARPGATTGGAATWAHPREGKKTGDGALGHGSYCTRRGNAEGHGPTWTKAGEIGKTGRGTGARRSEARRSHTWTEAGTARHVP